MSPQRIQMSRKHPWRAEHPDAVIVARPSLWGNPFKVQDWGLDLSVALYADMVQGISLFVAAVGSQTEEP